MQEAAIIKQPGQWPLTGSLRCACIYIVARRLDYCTQEVVLSQRAAKCIYVTLWNLACNHRNWTSGCFAISWERGLDRNVRWKAKHYTLLAHENGEVHAFVCLTIKSILSLNSFHNNSSVDCRWSSKSVSYSVQSFINKINRSEFSHSTVQCVDKVGFTKLYMYVGLVVYMDAKLQQAMHL